MQSKTSIDFLSPIADVVTQLMLVACMPHSEIPDLISISNAIEGHVTQLCCVAVNAIDSDILQVETGCNMQDIEALQAKLNLEADRAKDAATQLAAACAQLAKETASPTQGETFSVLSRASFTMLDGSLAMLHAWECLENWRLSTLLKGEPEQWTEGLAKLRQSDLVPATVHAWLKRYVQRAPLVYQAMRKQCQKHGLWMPRWARVCDQYQSSAYTLAWLASFVRPPLLAFSAQGELSDHVCQSAQSLLQRDPWAYFTPFIVMETLDPSVLVEVLLRLPNITQSSMSDSSYVQLKYASLPSDRGKESQKRLTQSVMELESLFQRVFPSTELHTFLPVVFSASEALLTFKEDQKVAEYCQKMFLEWEQLVLWHLQQFQAPFLDHQLIAMGAKQLLHAAESLKSRLEKDRSGMTWGKFADLKEGFGILLTSSASQLYATERQALVHQLSIQQVADSHPTSQHVERVVREYMALLQLHRFEVSDAQVHIVDQPKLPVPKDAATFQSIQNEVQRLLDACTNWIQKYPQQECIVTLHTLLSKVCANGKAIECSANAHGALSSTRDVIKAGETLYKDLEALAKKCPDTHYKWILNRTIQLFSYLLDHFKLQMALDLSNPKDTTSLDFLKVFTTFLHHMLWNCTKIALCPVPPTIKETDSPKNST